MEIETSKLEGAALDWAVSAATGGHDDGDQATMEIGLGRYSPSTNWSQGGPIIDKHITFIAETANDGCFADACMFGSEPLPIREWDGRGPTILTAAMRAIVAAELGEVVEVPDELVEVTA